MAADSGKDCKSIGTRIREVRTKRDMSQQELADAAHISLPHISQIELGKTIMKLPTFIRIAEALQVSADYLIRLDIPEVKKIYQTEFQDILADCSPAEIDSIFRVILELKSTMRSNKSE